MNKNQFLNSWARELDIESSMSYIDAKKFLHTFYSKAVGFEHLPSDAEDSGTATDHTVITPEISEVESIKGIRLTANSINETASVFLDLSDGSEIEFIKANGESIDYWKTLKELNLYGEKKGGEWISVTEKLPEEGKNVFVHTATGTTFEATYKKGLFYGALVALKIGEVLNWMPLPPPPKQ